MDKIIINILKKIEKNGFDAYIVGGYVRNKVIGVFSSDIDICTNALPKDIINIFKLDKNTKVHYGCVNIKTKKYNIDITTYRKESDYENHHPKTEYITDLKTDLKRRDFTCNSLIMDSNLNIIDYYDGIKDINNKIIRCVGSTKNKLKEDPVRILRAIRFATIYDFSIDEEIIEFINNNKDLIKNISYYRKKEELDKILSSNNKIKGLNLIKELNLCSTLDIKYDNINVSKDVLGMYAQLEFSDKYPLTKSERNIINDIRSILDIKEINNNTLYKYGLYINIIAGEILNVDYIKINKLYKSLPIKSKDDIKIKKETLYKLNNDSYIGINDIYKVLETNILNGKIKNKNKNIIKFLRK